MATVLKFSEAAALALHALVYLATGKSDGPVSAPALARVCRASEAHMTKVCQRLSRQGLLAARRGPTGGFLLAKKASQIRLLDVYEAVEGTVEFNDCLFPNRVCRGHADGGCVFGQEVRNLQESFVRYLRRTTVAAVAAHCPPDLGRKKA